MKTAPYKSLASSSGARTATPPKNITAQPLIEDAKRRKNQEETQNVVENNEETREYSKQFQGRNRTNCSREKRSSGCSLEQGARMVRIYAQAQ